MFLSRKFWKEVCIHCRFFILVLICCFSLLFSILLFTSLSTSSLFWFYLSVLEVGDFIFLLMVLEYSFYYSLYCRWSNTFRIVVFISSPTFSSSTFSCFRMSCSFFWVWAQIRISCVNVQSEVQWKLLFVYCMNSFGDIPSSGPTFLLIFTLLVLILNTTQWSLDSHSQWGVKIKLKKGCLIWWTREWMERWTDHKAVCYLNSFFVWKELQGSKKYFRMSF